MQDGIREAAPAAFHAARMTSPLRGRVIRGLVIGTIAAAVLAIIGALGTDQAPLMLRLGYWLAVVLPGSVLGIFIHTGIAAWGGLADRRWLEMTLVAIIVAIPHTFIVIVASMLMFGIGVLSIGTVFGFGAVVLMFSVILTAINYMSSAPDMPAPTSIPATLPAVELALAPVPSVDDQPAPLKIASAALPTGLSERLPPRLGGGRLIALEAEDHYLRIHTDLGSDIILMRMVDAVALLDTVTGARVHRSWWVARGAVEGSSSIDGRSTLRLATGLAVPVSRSMRPGLAAQGWSL
jgi:DNA-binding LytR/AlgR family response regulator